MTASVTIGYKALVCMTAYRFACSAGNHWRWAHRYAHASGRKLCDTCRVCLSATGRVSDGPMGALWKQKSGQEGLGSAAQPCTLHVQGR